MWAPCWPHRLCYQGSTPAPTIVYGVLISLHDMIVTWMRKVVTGFGFVDIVKVLTMVVKSVLYIRGTTGDIFTIYVCIYIYTYIYIWVPMLFITMPQISQSYDTNSHGADYTDRLFLILIVLVMNLLTHWPIRFGRTRRVHIQHSHESPASHWLRGVVYSSHWHG